jgi:hypothetical protein
MRSLVKERPAPDFLKSGPRPYISDTNSEKGHSLLFSPQEMKLCRFFYQTLKSCHKSGNFFKDQVVRNLRNSKYAH